MSDRRDIALRALRAAGHDQAADLVEAIIPAAQLDATPAAAALTPPAAPEIPAVPAPVAAANAGPQPPPGKAPLQTIDEWEALPKDERLARMDEVDALLLEGQS